MSSGMCHIAGETPAMLDPTMHSPRTIVPDDGRFLTCFMHHVTYSWVNIPLDSR